MLIINIILFLLGLFLLYIGSEYLVKNSADFARRIGIRAAIIGLTIVAYGTSTPEFFTSVVAALKEAEAIAIGNIVGSNIANIGLILGLAAMLRPLKVERTLLKRETPIMIFVSILFFLTALDLRIIFMEGCLLFLGIILFTTYSIFTAKEEDGNSVVVADEKATKFKNIFLALLGLGILIGGASLLVRSAVFIARALGISEFIIGVTIVAVGTSLPELAVSLVGAVKKEVDISIGNIIGSNIFNILLIGGFLAMITPISVSLAHLQIDFVVMLLFAFVLVPLLRTGLILSRVEGLVLLAAYVLYILYITEVFP